MEEIWKTTPQVAGFYEVSNLGRVRRTGSWAQIGKILKPQMTHQGYWQVSISMRQKPVHVLTHRLVCEAFHGPPQPGQQVNHKNEIKSDPHSDNLEWVTRPQNAKHSAKRISEAGKRYNREHPDWQRGSANHLARLTEKDIPEIRTAIQSGESRTSIAQRYSVGRRTITDIGLGKTWTHV